MLIVCTLTDSSLNWSFRSKSSFNHEENKPFGSDPYIFVCESNSDHFDINFN